MVKQAGEFNGRIARSEPLTVAVPRSRPFGHGRFQTVGDAIIACIYSVKVVRTICPGWGRGDAMAMAGVGFGLARIAVSALAAPCDDRAAVWATADDGHGVRHLLYGTRSIGEEGAMFIEEWRNGKRAWRTVAARVTCSDDVCTARFADETPPEEVEAAIESIDEDGDGLSDYLVLAGLAQELYYRGGAKVEWDEGFLAKKYGGMFERPSPGSNVFKFLRCGTEPIVLDRSTPYAENRVYHKYRETGSLGSDGTFPEGPGNDIWWMSGEQIQGSDINCVVKSFNADHTLTASCSAQDSDTTRDRIFSYRFEGMAVFLDDQRLQMLPRQ